ncbi:pilus assembly PilX N-terminal domain-containing protein [uncultured Cocleimonas sp.]|uniref:pilus assembly PilX family protein n=1 Tax=uncultured Cocleimonas sp. TaxID=1051587 RepID=UPI0026138A23|nr:pilus assembly PilX N-terminal domain-containing protein [uncultured Cocleimonas sp.]
MSFNRKYTLSRRQRGATLFTSLVFLALMTIVSVSASKISMMDVLISGNNEQSMRVFQTTANDLKKLTTPVNFYEAYIVNEHGAPWTHELPSEPTKEQKITSRNKEYYCGGFNGLAVSLGSDTSPCFLFDFNVNGKLPNSSIRDAHFRGAGKEFPNTSRNSSLN